MIAALSATCLYSAASECPARRLHDHGADVSAYLLGAVGDAGLVRKTVVISS